MEKGSVEFEERILLKLHRDYSNDEAIQLQQVVIKGLQYDVGVYKSEITELEDKIKKTNIRNNDLEVLNKELRNEIKAFNAPIVHY